MNLYDVKAQWNSGNNWGLTLHFVNGGKWMKCGELIFGDDEASVAASLRRMADKICPPKPAVSGWIKCIERLPNVAVVAIVTDGEDIGIAIRANSGWRWDVEEVPHGKVTHWMPLPELPKS